jgi:hypothetical protein
MNKNVYESVAAIGMDVHYKFSQVSMRDGQGRLVRRERLEHPDRVRLRERLSRWPTGVPVVMEASFGWGWLADLMSQQGLEVELPNEAANGAVRKGGGGRRYMTPRPTAGRGTAIAGTSRWRGSWSRRGLQSR